MTLHVELWQLLSFLGWFIVTAMALVFGGGKLLISQFEKQLDQRFLTQETKRKEAQVHWDNRFSQNDAMVAADAKEIQRIERDMMQLKVDLPIQYVRRDDYIRNQSVLESKIDGLAIRIENAILKGEHSHG